MANTLSPPAAPAAQIPLAYLPRLATSTGCMILTSVSSTLLLLLALDAWRSFKKKSHWIPGDSLLLGALTLQLLSLVNAPLLSISGDKELTQPQVQDIYNSIHASRLTVLAGRVVLCVFMGNLLPGVARHRARNLWTDILALAISAAAPLVHIPYEIYITAVQSRIEYGSLRWNFRNISFLASNVTLFVSIVLLLCLLCSASLASKGIQDMAARKIPLVLSTSHFKPQGFEESVLKSWLIARTCQPQYIVARSVLSCSTGLLVTVCVLTLAVESKVQGLKAEHDGFDWSRIMVLVQQWILILPGWAAVCWRWLTAVFYYPRLRNNELGAFFRVEDFWKRGLLELQEECTEMAHGSESIRELSSLKRFMVILFIKSRLYRLLPALLWLQIFVVLISKTCWAVSEFMFWVISGLAGIKARSESEGEEERRRFEKYSDALMRVSGEDWAGLWAANRNSIEGAKAWLGEGEADGRKCRSLISLLRTKTSNDSITLSSLLRFHLEREFCAGKFSTKMTAVSLLAVMTELSAFYENHQDSSTFRGLCSVKECTEACSQAWKAMEMIENWEADGAVVNKAADRVFHHLKQSGKWLGFHLPMNCYEEKSVTGARKGLQRVAKKAKEIAGGEDCCSADDSRNWKEVIAADSLCKVCEIINSLYWYNAEQMVCEIQNSLADLIGWCMLRIDKILLEQCRKWACDLEEEKLWDALHVAGLAKGVSEEVGLKLNDSISTDFIQRSETLGLDVNRVVTP